MDRVVEAEWGIEELKLFNSCCALCINSKSRFVRDTADNVPNTVNKPRIMYIDLTTKLMQSVRFESMLS